MPVAKTISLPQLLGTIPAVILLAILIIAVALFVIGYMKKAKSGSWRTYSWLLQSAAIWVFFYGVVIFAFSQTDAYIRVGAGLGSAEIWQSVNAESYARLCAASAVALFAWTLMIILGRHKE